MNHVVEAFPVRLAIAGGRGSRITIQGHGRSTAAGRDLRPRPSARSQVPASATGRPASASWRRASGQRQISCNWRTACGRRPFGTARGRSENLRDAPRPVPEPGVQFHGGLHVGMKTTNEAARAARARRRRCGPTIRKGPAISSVRPSRRREGMLQDCSQCGQCRVQELPSGIGERHAARRPMEEPDAQVLLQLRERLAGGLGRHVLRLGRLPQAAQLRDLDEDGDRAKLIDGHGRIIKLELAEPSRCAIECARRR